MKHVEKSPKVATPKLARRNALSLWISCGLALIPVMGSLQAAWAAPIESFADETYVTKQSRLWTEPTKFGEPIALLKPGVKLRVLRYSTSAAWVRAITEGDREGWIPVRFTALSGRRGQPLVSGSSASAELEAVELSSAFTASDRNPASLPTESASSSASGARKKPSPYEFHVGLGYINQLSRGSSSGVSGELSFQKNMSPTLGLFVGFDYHFVAEKNIAYDLDLSIRRRSNDIAPHLGVRWTPSEFSIGFALGYAYDSTTVTSRSISTGQVVYTSEGIEITGSGSTSMILVKINPRYLIALSKSSAMGVGLNYNLFVDLANGTNSFASEPDSRYLSNLGLVLSYNLGF
jgi:hypothetical protein